MTSSLEASDAAAAAVQKTPNRVSLDDLKAQIAVSHVFNAFQAIEAIGAADENDAPLKALTVCILVLKNGFTIIGKSAPADAENFNAELGAKFAYEDAVRQLWPLEGYRLRSHLAAA